MSDYTDHPLYHVLKRIKLCQDRLAFDPGRSQEAIREIRKLLVDLEQITVLPLPTHDEKDTHIRHALSVLIEHMTRRCNIHRQFKVNFHALIEEQVGKIESELSNMFADSNVRLSPPPRYRSNHPPWVGLYLKRWLFIHRSLPHPSTEEKNELSKITGLTREQISDWLVRIGYHNLKNSVNTLTDSFDLLL